MRLTKREKRLSFALAIFIAGWLLYGQIISPTQARLDRLGQLIPEKTAVLQEVKDKAREYQTLRERLDRFHTRLARQPADFNLLPWLEKLLADLELDKNITAMKPQSRPLNDDLTENIVTLELDDIAINRLLALLTRLSTAPAPLRISTLTLDESPTQPDRLTAALTLSNPTTPQTQ